MRTNDRDQEFHRFVAERSGPLLRLAYLLSADAATAEDVLQTALVRAYLRWGRIATNPEAYVRRVVVTTAADERRRPYRRREVSADRVVETPDPADPFGSAEVSHRLREALRSLPPGQRAAVVLRHWVGLEPTEAAELMGCSPENVRSQTARGLDKLRAAYARESGSPVELER
jgi:RNA polymerase sigma-70 factor (sigma-E family)